jgi:hypothetical protein
MLQRYVMGLPVGSYYVEGDEREQVLYHKDGTRVWCFDPAAVLEPDIMLAALEDHSNFLSMSESERAQRRTEAQQDCVRTRRLTRCMH